MSIADKSGYQITEEPQEMTSLFGEGITPAELTYSATATESSVPTVDVVQSGNSARFDFGIPKGKKGDKGDTGATPTVTATATVDNTTGTPSVSVTKTEADDTTNFKFAFTGLKGEEGSGGSGSAVKLTYKMYYAEEATTEDLTTINFTTERVGIARKLGLEMNDGAFIDVWSLPPVYEDTAEEGAVPTQDGFGGYEWKLPSSSGLSSKSCRLIVTPYSEYIGITMSGYKEYSDNPKTVTIDNITHENDFDIGIEVDDDDWGIVKAGNILAGQCVLTQGYDVKRNVIAPIYRMYGESQCIGNGIFRLECSGDGSTTPGISIKLYLDTIINNETITLSELVTGKLTLPYGSVDVTNGIKYYLTE